MTDPLRLAKRMKLMGLCLTSAQMDGHVAAEMQNLVDFVREHPEIVTLGGPETADFGTELFKHAHRVAEVVTASLVISKLHEAGHKALGDDAEHDEQSANLLRSVFPEGEVEL